jgi:hypothetical protein
MLALFILSAAQAASNDEKSAVQKVVEEAYVQGVHANPSAAAMRKGFHPDFIMFMLDAGQVKKVTRDEWIGRLEAAQAKNGSAPKAVIKHEFPLVEITGSAAIVKVEIHRDGKHIFSDYLSLYKFDDGWKIIGKIFYRHPAS